MVIAPTPALTVQERFPTLDDNYNAERIAAIGMYLFGTDDTDTLISKVDEPAPLPPQDCRATTQNVWIKLYDRFIPVLKILKKWDERTRRDPKLPGNAEIGDLLDNCGLFFRTLNHDKPGPCFGEYPFLTGDDMIRIRFLGNAIFGKSDWPNIENRALKHLSHPDWLGDTPMGHRDGPMWDVRTPFAQLIADLVEYKVLCTKFPDHPVPIPKVKDTLEALHLTVLRHQAGGAKAYNPYL